MAAGSGGYPCCCIDREGSSGSTIVGSSSVPCACCANGQAPASYRVDVSGVIDTTPVECANCADADGTYIVDTSISCNVILCTNTITPIYGCDYCLLMSPASCGEPLFAHLGLACGDTEMIVNFDLYGKCVGSGFTVPGWRISWRLVTTKSPGETPSCFYDGLVLPFLSVYPTGTCTVSGSSQAVVYAL